MIVVKSYFEGKKKNFGQRKNWECAKEMEWEEKWGKVVWSEIEIQLPTDFIKLYCHFVLSICKMYLQSQLTLLIINGIYN